MRETRNVYRILMGKPGGKRPLGRPRRRSVDYVKIDLREIGLDRTGSGCGPVEGFCEHSTEPSGSIKFWENFE
jgi:hypothetical protein